MDIIAAWMGLGLCYLFMLGFFLGIKTKKGRKILGIE